MIYLKELSDRLHWAAVRLKLLKERSEYCEIRPEDFAEIENEIKWACEVAKELTGK